MNFLLILCFCLNLWHVQRFSIEWPVIHRLMKYQSWSGWVSDECWVWTLSKWISCWFCNPVWPLDIFNACWLNLKWKIIWWDGRWHDHWFWLPQCLLELHFVVKWAVERQWKHELLVKMNLRRDVNWWIVYALVYSGCIWVYTFVHYTFVKWPWCVDCMLMSCCVSCYDWMWWTGWCLCSLGWITIFVLENPYKVLYLFRIFLYSWKFGFVNYISS